MTEQQKLAPNRPTHRAYVVKDQGADKKGRWIEIGAAWVHKDGKGFSVKLDACPTNGERIECRMIDWKAIDEGRKETQPDDETEGY